MRHKKMPGRWKFSWIYVLCVAVLGIGLATYLGLERIKQRSVDDAPPVALPVPEPTDSAPPAPSHPIEQAPPGEPQAEPAPAPPPPEPTADEFDDALTTLLGVDVVARHLIAESLIRRLVVAVDNAPREAIVERVRPWRRIPGEFEIDGYDKANNDGGAAVISERNYSRYDAIVGVIVGVDTEAAESVYRRFYPLFQSEYEKLGYPDGYFNDRCVAVIDHLLATPERSGPLRLVRPHVLFEYADPDLEALSVGQKMLLRVGVGNARLLKAKLRDVRVAIASQEAADSPE